MNRRKLLSQILFIAGGIGMAAGAVDPLEGSVVILPASLLMALGTLLGKNERRLVLYRMVVFILIGIGVWAMLWLSSVGGFGGKSEYSMWWGLLVLPYLAGWSMGMWGPGSPRWLLALGIGNGLWYVTILAMSWKSMAKRGDAMFSVPVFILAVFGLLTIGGCISRWRQRTAEQPRQSGAGG
jgi:hypothetical protein